MTRRPREGICSVFASPRREEQGREGQKGKRAGRGIILTVAKESGGQGLSSSLEEAAEVVRRIVHRYTVKRANTGDT